MFSRSTCFRRVLARNYASLAKKPVSNEDIVLMLKKCMEREDSNALRNPYKMRAFAAAIKVLDQYPSPIKSVDELKNVKGIGSGIMGRVEAFLEGREYEPPGDTPSDRMKLALESAKAAELQRIPGVGPTKAKQLVAAGCSSIAELRSKQEYLKMLTGIQRVSARFFEHMQEDVTRQQAEHVMKFLSQNISSDFELHLTGGYRRNIPSSHIEFLLMHPSHVHIPVLPPPSTHTSKNNYDDDDEPNRRGRAFKPFRAKFTSARVESESILKQQVVKPLIQRGLIADTLSEGERKWTGVVRIPFWMDGEWEERGRRLLGIRNGEGVFRRMDLNLVPQKCKGAALLALTGDTQFVRDTRIRASRLGLHLNEFGLWRWKTDDSTKSGFWELLHSETEEGILDALGMEFVHPEKRNFSFMTRSRSTNKFDS